MHKIINIKHKEDISSLKVAYCGLNYDYWKRIYPAINNMADFSILGKPRNLIVRGNRPQTVENYRQYAIDRMHKDDKFWTALHQLASFDTLACWCKPQQCHCEVIADLYIQLINNFIKQANEWKERNNES